MNKDKPCQWCRSTSEQIDSLEYEVEQLKALVKRLNVLVEDYCPFHDSEIQILLDKALKGDSK